LAVGNIFKITLKVGSLKNRKNKRKESPKTCLEILLGTKKKFLMALGESEWIRAVSP